jgi:2-polyprenyl-3-methyl-5-hydroxy-6-metoxy-1,4-benzoquinol methylase
MRVGTPSRYDDFADWYDDWVGDDPGLLLGDGMGLIPDSLADCRVLDLACGQGRVTHELARRGARAVGVDISEQLLGKARIKERNAVGRIDYHHADATKPPSWWDGVPFDLVVCEMALMDIPDLRGALATVSAVLRPGGQFHASVVHPCCPGTDTGLASWPTEGYDVEGWWTSQAHNPDGARIRVGAYHRTLSTYLNAFIQSGLAIDRVIEPAAPVPTLLVVSCHRQ